MIRILLICQLLLYIGSLFDLILKIGIHTVFLRYISHFLGMNWALLLGFIRYFKGVKTNVWNQPNEISSKLNTIEEAIEDIKAEK